jgi:hypothetical protein
MESSMTNPVLSLITAMKQAHPLVKKQKSDDDDLFDDEPPDVQIGFESRYPDDPNPFGPLILDVTFDPFQESAHKSLKGAEIHGRMMESWEALMTHLKSFNGWFTGPHTHFSLCYYHDVYNLYVSGRAVSSTTRTTNKKDFAKKALIALETIAKLEPANRLFLMESDHPLIGAGNPKDANTLMAIVDAPSMDTMSTSRLSSIALELVNR